VLRSVRKLVGVFIAFSCAASNYAMHYAVANLYAMLYAVFTSICCAIELCYK
jgi:hypothetical protein